MYSAALPVTVVSNALMAAQSVALQSLATKPKVLSSEFAASLTFTVVGDVTASVPAVGVISRVPTKAS